MERKGVRFNYLGDTNNIITVILTTSKYYFLSKTSHDCDDRSSPSAWNRVYLRRHNKWIGILYNLKLVHSPFHSESNTVYIHMRSEPLIYYCNCYNKCLSRVVWQGRKVSNNNFSRGRISHKIEIIVSYYCKLLCRTSHSIVCYTTVIVFRTILFEFVHAYFLY